eukprot:31351-Pelagococcus_subviridis.AAC.9
MHAPQRINSLNAASARAPSHPVTRISDVRVTAPRVEVPASARPEWEPPEWAPPEWWAPPEQAPPATRITSPWSALSSVGTDEDRFGAR